MSIEQFPGARWLQRNWNELQQFNFEWVAANGEGLIAHDSELEIVMNEVIEENLVNHVVYAFVDFDEVDIDRGETV